MTNKETLDILYKEKDDSHKDFLYYNDMLVKILTISISIFTGLFIIGIDKEKSLFICALPFAILLILSICQFVGLLSYASDNVTRIYEKAINKKANLSVSFRHSQIQNIFHDHSRFYGFSIEAMISVIIVATILITFYIFCSVLGCTWINNNKPYFLIFYKLFVSISPVLIFISFSISKKRLDKKLSENEKLLLEQLTEVEV